MNFFNFILGPIPIYHNIQLLALIAVLEQYPECKLLASYIKEIKPDFEINRKVYFRQLERSIYEKSSSLIDRECGFAHSYSFIDETDSKDRDFLLNKIKIFKSLEELEEFLFLLRNQSLNPLV